MERKLYTPTRRELLLTAIGASLFAACARPESQPSNFGGAQPGVIPDKTSALPSEKPPEPGWTRFRSLNYPYQIDYPQGWFAQSDLFLNNKHPQGLESLHTAGVRIRVQQVQDFVRLDDYVAQRISSLPKDAQALAKTEGVTSGIRGIALTYVYTGSAYSMGEIVNFPFLATSGRIVNVVDNLMLKDQKIWNIQFAGDGSEIDSFVKMNSTFRFLK